MFEFVVVWTFALGGSFMAVFCGLNCLGLARGWMRNDAGPIGNLGLGMVSAGLAGFLWAMPVDGSPVEAWRYYWLILGGVGLILMVGVQARADGQTAAFWRWVTQGARIHTSQSEWRRKHFLVIAVVAASFFAIGLVPGDSWWFWVVFVPFLALTDKLKTLPIHFGRRPPNPPGPATEP